MPRTAPIRVSQVPITDSSQSSNVPLQPSSLGNPLSAGATLRSVASALNGLGSTAAEILQRRKEAQAAQQKQQDAEDLEAGKAAAAQRAVTGVEPTLETQSAAFVQGYQQTDGLRIAGDFENQLLPKLAKLEPGQDVDKFIRDQANEFVGSSDMKPETQRTFMLAVAQQQPAWKENYLKQSIQEADKRETESLGALATDQIHKGVLTTPEGYQSFLTLAQHKGMTEDEVHKIVASAASVAMSDGKTDVGKVMGWLKTIKVGSDGGSLADVPEYKESFDLASKRGQAVQDAEQKKAQEGALTQALFHLFDKADNGVLADTEIERMRAQYDLTPEWAASMHNRNREAQQRLQVQADKAQADRYARQLWVQGSPLQIEAFGRDKVEKAGSELLKDAVDTGDMEAVKRLTITAARNGSPWQAMKSALDSINTADSQRATQLAQLYETVASVSPDYANKLVSEDTKAKLGRYLRETREYGASPEQAWETVRNSQAVDPSILTKQVADLWRRREKDIPTDFNDTPWYNPLSSDTKVQNLAVVKSEVRRLTSDLLATGQYADDPDKAFDAAWEKFKGTHVQVGNQYVPTFGTTEHVEPQTAKAMTDYSISYKNRMVSEGKLGKDDEVWFRPDPNSPGKWTAFEMVGGVPFPVSNGSEIVQVNPNAVRVQHNAWRAQEDSKKAVFHQGINQLGLSTVLGSDTPDAIRERIKAIPEDAVDSYADRMGTRESLPEGLRTPEQRKAALEFVNDPKHAQQDFIDFIHSNTK